MDKTQLDKLIELQRLHRLQQGFALMLGLVVGIVAYSATLAADRFHNAWFDGVMVALLLVGLVGLVRVRRTIKNTEDQTRGSYE